MKPSPSRCERSGQALPPAVVTAPAICCLRNTSFDHSPFGIPEPAALMQIVKRKMYLSIIAGSFFRLVRIRVLWRDSPVPLAGQLRAAVKLDQTAAFKALPIQYKLPFYPRTNGALYSALISRISFSPSM